MSPCLSTVCPCEALGYDSLSPGAGQFSSLVPPRVSNCVQAAPANRASCGALQDRYAANSCRASGQEGPYEQAHPLRRSPRANCVAEREKIGEEAAAHLIMDAGARLHGYSR